MNATTTQPTPAHPVNPYADAIQAIRADICTHLATARDLRTTRQDVHGPTRHSIDLSMRAIGNGSYWIAPKGYDLPPARYLYAALAFLRGRSFASVEGSCPTYQDIDMHACPIIRRTNPIDASHLTRALGRYLTAEQYAEVTGDDEPKRGTGTLRQSKLALWMGDSIMWGNYRRLESKAA